jgi:hypothetical protein
MSITPTSSVPPLAVNRWPRATPMAFVSVKQPTFGFG